MEQMNSNKLVEKYEPLINKLVNQLTEVQVIINNNIIKNIVQRPRPFRTFQDLQIIIPTPSEFSFPSGHSAASFAASVCS